MPGPRKRIRLRYFDYAQTGAYFVTVCTCDRALLFGDVVDDRTVPSNVGAAVTDCWHELPGHFAGIELDEFVLMPNHIHGIVALDGAGHARPLPVVIGSFKSASARQAGRPIWQRSYYERVLRDEQELEAARCYIADNPIKWATDPKNPAVRAKRR